MMETRCCECGETWPCWYSLNAKSYRPDFIVKHSPKVVDKQWVFPMNVLFEELDKKRQDAVRLFFNDVESRLKNFIPTTSDVANKERHQECILATIEFVEKNSKTPEDRQTVAMLIVDIVDAVKQLQGEVKLLQRFMEILRGAARNE